MTHLRHRGGPPPPGRGAAPRPQGRGWCRALRLSESEGGEYARPRAGRATRHARRGGAAPSPSASPGARTIRSPRPRRALLLSYPATSVPLKDSDRGFNGTEVAGYLRTIEGFRPGIQIPNTGSVSPFPNPEKRMIGSLVPGGPSPHVHAKRERRRAEILRVALRAFRERGYHATTLDSIAEQLGVGKTALYHYFPDKQAILLACHRESLADLERIVAQARRLDTARERLRYVIMEHVRVMTEAFGASPLAFEVGALSAERQAEIVDGRDRYERALRDIIEQGMKLGTFRRADSKVTAFAILGALNGIALE